MYVAERFATGDRLRFFFNPTANKASSRFWRRELQERLRVHVHNTLLTLFRQSGIDRERIARVYVYVPTDPVIRRNQLERRQALIAREETASVEVEVVDRIIIEVLLVLLRHPGSKAADVVRYLRGHSLPLSGDRSTSMFRHWSMPASSSPWVGCIGAFDWYRTKPSKRGFRCSARSLPDTRSRRCRNRTTYRSRRICAQIGPAMSCRSSAIRCARPESLTVTVWWSNRERMPITARVLWPWIRGDEATLKWIAQESERVILCPEHSALEPMEFDLQDVVIQGVLVGQMHSYR